MKKIAFFLIPLMIISFLTNCGNNPQLIDITFDANGGYFDNTTTVTSKVVPTIYGKIPIAPIPAKNRTDELSYTFKGWDKTLEPAESKTTYTAQWTETKNKYHVTFNANGGTISSGGEPIDVDYGDKIATAPIVIRDGYDATAVKWYDAATGGNEFTFGVTPVTSNLTLFAHWGNIKKYTVVFNANGGTYAETSSDIVTIKDVVYNTMPPIPNAPSKVDPNGLIGYIFIGYDKNVVPVTGDESTITYTAKWAETHSVYTMKIYAANEEGESSHFPDGSLTKTLTLAAGNNIKSALSLLDNPIYGGDKTLQTFNNYIYKDGTKIKDDDIVHTSNIEIKATYRNKTLEECSWEEIKDVSKKGPEYAQSFFGPVIEKNESGVVIARHSIEKTVMVNNQPHKVRIIGYGEDYKDVTDETTKIGITFEFVNLISDFDGYSFATFWKNVALDVGANNDYVNSSIRKALVNVGNGDLNWFTKDKKKFSNYYTSSVYDMLPKDLKDQLIAPSKYINIYSSSSWMEKTVSDKLFLLTPVEIGNNTDHDHEEKNTKVYSFYTSSSTSDRIKHQVRWHEGAKDTPLQGKDLDGEYQESKTSYAGHNQSTSSYGSYYWLRSPFIDNSKTSYRVGFSGSATNDYAYSMACGVAPAFCI